MSTYLVAQIQIEDRERYARYEAGFMDIFKKYEGELLAVDDASQQLEGDWPYTRMVVLRFPDEKSARAWYESDDYQELAQHRLAASTGTLTLVKGF